MNKHFKFVLGGPWVFRVLNVKIGFAGSDHLCWLAKGCFYKNAVPVEVGIFSLCNKGTFLLDQALKCSHDVEHAGTRLHLFR